MGETSASLAVAHAGSTAESRRLAQVMTTRGGVVSEARIASMSCPTITACVGTACVLLGLSVIWRGDASETAAGFWPPAGASLVAMLVFPVRRWGWVVAGIGVPTVVGLTFGLMPLSSGLWWAVANAVEPAIAALVLLGFISSRWFTRGRLLLLFLVVAVVVAPIVGGAIGGMGTVIGYGDRWSDVWLPWAVGDGLGVLVVVPLFMKYTAGAVKRRTTGELGALIVVVAIATALAFVDIGRDGAALLPYLILVVLIWAGMRFGTRSVAAAGFVVGLGANIATSQGLGPFSEANRFANIVTLQIFLAIALVTSFVVAAMASELADHDEVRQLLTYQATHDSLTGLPNRVLFGEWLKTALEVRGQSDPGVGVLLIDLDDFKKINDRHGHPIGDVALKAVAERLRRSIRPGDVLATLGGDEFVVMSDDVTSAQHAHTIARGLSRALAQPYDVGVGQSQVTASIGIAVALGDDPVMSSDLLHRADIALHHAKATPGTISLFDDFGTGYSSMAYLRRMPVSTLKIDRSFVTGLGDEAEATAIIRSIIELGHSFGLEVVAEGVETLRQLRQLVELGCDHGQGFYWSPAVGPSAAGNMLRERLFVPDRVLPSGIDVARIEATTV